MAKYSRYRRSAMQQHIVVCVDTRDRALSGHSLDSLDQVIRAEP